jgi:TRAP-type mannitol/chloroaromatic compound transport system permease large subunit
VADKYVTVAQVFRGVLPFILADLIVVAIAVAFPVVILFLPSLMN